MRHPYHMLFPSPWPMLIAFNLLSLLTTLVGILAGYNNSLMLFMLSFIMVLYMLYNWLYDIMMESLYLGYHSNSVTRSLMLGFMLFIITEIMFFFSLFWAYFHSALNPYYLIWPPIGMDLINPWSIPLLNTLLLLYSGVTATWAHHEFSKKNKKQSLIGLYLTIFLGFIFFLLQVFEYTFSSFDITDSIFGSTFYITTGTHAIHMICGLLFFMILTISVYNSNNCSLLFDISLLYFHFLDMMWMALFMLMYYMAY